ncbi:RmlC-like cupin domain-containing protein [Stachybotrys elegans]|uniref:RmlC-like cupin domain-containing protein n=1 Tax=Stachybotrys elegans TaxID=80388 RepID=A0A8K0WV38_9HYPO|nr:RmlC-like cupin domain-containing protein [Stachybotrys elegans]
MSAANQPAAGETEEMQEFLAALPSQHVEPLWSQMSMMVPPTPNPAAKAHIWKYEDTLPHLESAGRLVPEEKAERRVLMLVNPNLKSPFTTDTIYAGLQLVNPGETAPAHRHIAFACRFIMDGDGFTAVEGKKMPLTRGDVVVTPVWHWHDHGNESDKPVIWLDLLNLPLFTYARVNFAENYASPRYPSELQDPCEWRHPWTKPLSEILAMQAESIDIGHATEETRDAASFVYHCYEGEGRTEIESPSGEKSVFQWKARDTFAVPAWSKIKHFNESKAEKAYLVACHDGPFLDNLGLRKPVM